MGFAFFAVEGVGCVAVGSLGVRVRVGLGCGGGGGGGGGEAVEGGEGGDGEGDTFVGWTGVSSLV